jgi:hypothetical protein
LESHLHLLDNVKKKVTTMQWHASR